MDLKQFLSERPQKTCERDSLKAKALREGLVYVSLITKKGVESFRVSYKEGDIEKTFQMKKTAKSIEYLHKYSSNIVYSEKALRVIECHQALKKL